MPINYVSGDPALTQADVLALGHNARGRTELGALETRLMQQFSPAFATYTRLARRGQQTPGTWWLWVDTRPQLAFLTVRSSSVGATRLRYVESVLMSISREYEIHAIKSIALAPLGNQYEQEEILKLIERWLSGIRLPVVAYTEYVPDVAADEAL
ncbi:MAG: hypothetical protein KC546_06705 [Anaerolineae bacterium]|nr:hypothetical protein [Anaerolineae bacterium]MCA9894958.1 hypothetical protein [Anaerolineae bacterium]